MTPRPQVSVLLPTIAVDGWLDSAVNSLLQDEGEVPIEVIVIHDGVVPDRDRGWMHDDRVRVLHNERRRGLVAGLIAGAAASDADLLARLDADDVSNRGRLRTQVDYLTEHPATVLVAGEARRIDSDGADLGPYPSRATRDARPQLTLRNVIVHSSVMFRRDVYLHAGGYDPGMSQMEDYDLWLRMGLHGALAILPGPLVDYRIHSGQVNRGAAPHGYHVDRVRTSRRALARHIGVPGPVAIARDLVWRAAQYERYYLKVRLPRV